MLSSLTRSGGPLRLLSKTWSFVNTRANCSQEGTPSAAEKGRHKAPLEAPSPEECCGTGCSDCIFLKYAEELVDYYRDGGVVALQEVDKITDPSVRVFVKTEIKFYLALDQDMRERMKKSRDGATTKPQE